MFGDLLCFLCLICLSFLGRFENLALIFCFVFSRTSVWLFVVVHLIYLVCVVPSFLLIVMRSVYVLFVFVVHVFFCVCVCVCVRVGVLHLTYMVHGVP